MIAINQETNEMLTVGAAGGPKIVSASVQALVNFIDFGMGTKGSVDAARLHCHGRQIEVEPGISVGVLARLREIGHDVVTVPRIALLQMIHKSTGGWEGASDSRGPGRASVLIEDSGHIVSRDFGYSNSKP
jgi:gamma-glutamyltranspeptidase/glutathione hydrolase